jgi:4-alpha-glucanotransferase
LIGDLPIFVAHDSADVWAHRDLFLLDASGKPRVKSGYPPDCFSANGQTWGHPQYNWAMHEKSGFSWWIDRFKAMYRWFDATRIDHFLGFHHTWHIPGNATTARRGKWSPTPGAKIFTALRRAMGHLPPIIAEDLGQLTAEAASLRDRFGFPGMRVMQFGFGAGGADYHLPHRYTRHCVAYTGTHDNETIVGWFERLRQFSRNGHSTPAIRAEYQKVLRYLDSTGRNLHWDAIRSLMQSVADTVIVPVQDVLGLGNEARMNVPGQPEGNWAWRLRSGQLTAAHAARLADLCDVYDRSATTTPRHAGRGVSRARVVRRRLQTAR